MDTRKPLIAGNWKMYKTPAQAGEAAARLAELTRDVTGADVMIAPVYTALHAAAKAFSGSPVALGAQNLFWETEGAFTGEVSAPMLKESGCTHVIIGHSERRQYFGETDETVNKKLHAALSAGLIPVVCVGETQQQREAGKTMDVLDTQISGGLDQAPGDPAANPLVIAYEPVWAIGTGLTATKEQAQQAHEHIRKKVSALLGKPLAKAVRILYGGSVKPANIAELMQMPDIDGALVGGASLDPETFIRIVKFG